MSWYRALYTLLFWLLLPAIFVRLLWRGRRNRLYWQRWPERLGLLSPASCPQQPVICLHAVSVGETMAAQPLIERLLEQYPEYCLWVTSATPTGSATVQRLFENQVRHSYLPYDTPGAVQRFLGHVNPQLLLVMETELWPNLYAACAQRGIPLLVVNARLSARSARRYRYIAGLVKEMLVSAHAILARTETDAARFIELGAPAVCVQVAGNIKFSLAADTSIHQQAIKIRKDWRERPVWCAGSTHEGEDPILLEQHAKLRQQWPDLLLILVPRHPERFADVFTLCKKYDFVTTRRSRGQLPGPDSAVFLADSMGELLLWYACSDVAFIGGSLVPVGGHNPLEALAWGVPVISGRHIDNFADLYPQLESLQCARLVDSGAALHNNLAHWFTDKADRLSSGEAGKDFLRENRGVVERLMQVVTACLECPTSPLTIKKTDN